jgi:hypothetical protein
VVFTLWTRGGFTAAVEVELTVGTVVATQLGSSAVTAKTNVSLRWFAIYKAASIAIEAAAGKR